MIAAVVVVVAAVNLLVVANLLAVSLVAVNVSHHAAAIMDLVVDMGTALAMVMDVDSEEAHGSGLSSFYSSSVEDVALEDVV